MFRSLHLNQCACAWIVHPFSANQVIRVEAMLPKKRSTTELYNLRLNEISVLYDLVFYPS